MKKKIFKVALGVEYNGSAYHGWQYQSFASNIQEKIEFALSIIADHPIRVYCAGRTDAGVHSTGQVVHFYTYAIRSNYSWVIGVNSYLPNDISVIWKHDVPDDFHARYSALSRRYRYVIYNHYYRSSIFYQGLYYFYKKLNITSMNLAAKYLVGEHDFTAFRSSRCQSNTPIRRILYLNIFRVQRNLVIIDIIANSFLHHMVRKIVGCLLEVGTSRKKDFWIKDILKSKNKNFSILTVKPNGLYLVQVTYSSLFKLPNIPIGPFFI